MAVHRAVRRDRADIVRANGRHAGERLLHEAEAVILAGLPCVRRISALRAPAQMRRREAGRVLDAHKREIELAAVDFRRAVDGFDFAFFRDLQQHLRPGDAHGEAEHAERAEADGEEFPRKDENMAITFSFGCVFLSTCHFDDTKCFKSSQQTSDAAGSLRRRRCRPSSSTECRARCRASHRPRGARAGRGLCRGASCFP